MISLSYLHCILDKNTVDASGATCGMPYNTAQGDIRPTLKHVKALRLKISFHRLEVVSRYRDPQPQVRENYSYLLEVRPNLDVSTHIPSNHDNSDLFNLVISMIKRIKNGCL